MSVLGILIGPQILSFIVHSVSSPFSPLGISVRLTDLLFPFFFCGIAAVIYHVLFDKHIVALPRPHRLRLHPTHVHWILHLIIGIGFWAGLSLLLILLFPTHALSAILTGTLIMGLYMIAARHDLLIDALISGLFMMSLLFVLEQLFFIRIFPGSGTLFSFWKMGSQIHLAGIPIEDLLWTATVGFTLGPLYEYVRRFRLR